MSNTQRSSSRSKRSTTNLSNLRLAPLSARYAEPQIDRGAPKSPYEEAAEATLAKYAQRAGRSMPSTPSLSPGTNRRHTGGGLSRRGSWNEDDSEPVYQYATARKTRSGGDDSTFTMSITKSMSDAALNSQPLEGSGVHPTKKKYYHKRSKTAGANTPRLKSKSDKAEDDWLSHAGATANALLLESKGHTWMSPRPSSTDLVIADDNDDDDDEGYEEMAALSACTTRLAEADGTTTPRPDKWGSRFGSRPGSRHTSRRGSMATGAMTPLASIENVAGYFEHPPNTPLSTGPILVEESDEDSEVDAAELTELTKDRSFGLGPVVDRLMFNLLDLPDAEESGTETANEAETAAEARARRTAEAERRKQEKERLVALPAPDNGRDGEKVGVWKDAGWLFSVATRAFAGS